MKNTMVSESIADKYVCQSIHFGDNNGITKNDKKNKLRRITDYWYDEENIYRSLYMWKKIGVVWGDDPIL